MSKAYHLSVPISGELYVVVSADSEEEAKEKFWSEADFRVSVKSEGDVYVELGEYQAHEHLVQGNVCYASCVRMEVVDVEDED